MNNDETGPRRRLDSKEIKSQFSTQSNHDARRRRSSTTPGQQTESKQSGYTLSELDTNEASKGNASAISNRSGFRNTFVFTLGELKSVHKPIRNYVYYVKMCFLCFQSFNLVYLSVLLHFIFRFTDNLDFRIIVFDEFGLTLITIVVAIRLVKSLYGIYAVLFAKSRRPLYLFLLFNYFVSCLYILVGLFVLFTPYIRKRFETAMTKHLRALTYHYDNERPTWYLIENAQYYGQCCGYQSFIDYLRIYADEYQSNDLFRADYYLPLTCCKNAIRGDTCSIHKVDIILRGCAEFVQVETMKRINLPITVLLVFDVLSLIFIVQLMRRFKDNLVRIEIKEDENLFLEREEARLVKELLAERFIQAAESKQVKQKYMDTINLERLLNLRPTMEGLTLIVKRDGPNIEMRTLDPGVFRFETSNNYKYLEDQFKSGFNDLFNKQKETPSKKELDHELMPTKMKIENRLLMTGGEKVSAEDAEKHLAEFGLEKKILPWQAVRTRNAVLQINVRQDKSKNLRKRGLKRTVVRFNSLEARLDRQTIERDLKELKAKGEVISQEVKNKMALSVANNRDAERMNIRIVRKDTERPATQILRKGKRRTVKTTSDIIEDKEINSDELWSDIRGDK